MKPNLDSLRSEIEHELESRGMAVFHGFPRMHEAPAVYWDSEAHPDYREFLDVAQKCGVKLVTLYANEFSNDLIEDAEQRLESIPREERREMEATLRRLRGYAGFISQIELSFDFAPRVYIFDLHTDWFDDLNDLLDQIGEAEEEDDDGETPLGGYFSKN